MPHRTMSLARLAATVLTACACAGVAQAQEGGTPRTDAYVARTAKQSEAVVRAYLAALDRGDAPAAAALIDPGLSMADHIGDCRRAAPGAACLRRLVGRTVAARTRLTIDKLTVERDIVRVKLSLDAPAIEAKAGGPLTVTDEFVVAGDKISAFVRTPHTEEAATRAYYGRPAQP